MTGRLGAGVSPLGTQPYGYGTPATVPTPGGLVNRLGNGTQNGSLLLSLSTGSVGQYVFDAFGRRRGSDDVRHMVTLALLTRRGTCVVQDLGQRFFDADKVTESFAADQKARVDEALGALVGRGLVRVDSVEVEPKHGHPANTRVFLTDLTTNKPIDIAI